MTKRPLESTRMLQWVFCRNHRTITCEIDANGTHAFDVCIVPHWNVSESVIQRFDTAAHAFERHAELARELADAGWVHAAGERPHVGAVAA